MTEPNQPTPPATQPPVTVVLPDGAAEGLVVGPGDFLVVRLGPSVPLSEVEALAADLGKGPLRGRGVVIAAEQIGVMRA